MKRNYLFLTLSPLFFLAAICLVLVLGYNIYVTRADNTQAELEAKISQDIETSPSPSTLMRNENSTKRMPNTLTIPAVGIRAPIVNVGITVQGAMNVPEDFGSVGLYKFAVAPGEKGKAVMAGHVDNALGVDAVFSDLDKLRIGDDVYVTNAEGVEMRFVVKDKKVYDTQNFPSKEIFGESAKAELNLITCDGTWIQSKKSYDKRLVVFTELAD